MLKNYCLVAWKVFCRRKFFTFVNLFGIALTLTVVMLGVSVAVDYLYPSGPEKNSDHYLSISRLVLTNKERTSASASSPGFQFLLNNVLPLKSPQIIAIATMADPVNSFVGDTKYSQMVRYTDANYWRILDFHFLQGSAFDQSQLNDGAKVAVIDAQTAQSRFVGGEAVGHDLLVGEQTYRVIGVVEDVPVSEVDAVANVWLPYTTQSSTSYRDQDEGNWLALLYHDDASQLPLIQSEYRHRLEHDLRLTVSNEFSDAFSGAFSKLETISQEIFREDLEYSYESGVQWLLGIVSVITIVFMALPSINLINLNVSRIYERASEIGVRKAFGASSRQLVGQFMVENLLLSLVGGLIGMMLSSFILSQVESSGLFPGVHLQFSWIVFTYGLLMILVFSLLSGAYPAFKMSRLDPVQSLKEGAR